VKKILITGGAGFVGSHIALALKKEFPLATVVALDNLRRRGSELNLPRLAAAGVLFTHGDVRNRADLDDFADLSLLVECSAEPSVLAAYQGSLDYVIQTNLVGTLNCLELVRRGRADIIFVSTSRVYPIKGLKSIKLDEDETRFRPRPNQSLPGFSDDGVSEQFALDGARSLYGATKLASELMLQEYVDAYGIRGVINRCGVLTGPWQMGKVDQGFVVLWVARHLFERPLAYVGYDGSGKQVRDILHIDDLCRLVIKQIAGIKECNGELFNVGGGNAGSVSLVELTRMVREATGCSTHIDPVFEARTGDIPYYVSDCRKAMQAFGWEPRRTPPQIIEEITSWIGQHRESLKSILA
jgi:CDP-paratose 2-epimerase